MDYTIATESFTSLASYWSNPRDNLRWNSLFTLPGWLETWWQVFGSNAETYLSSVRQGNKIIGIAPLLIKDKTASIIGSGYVCDHVDFIVAPGRERDFFTVLLDDLYQKGIDHLELASIRPDSTIFTDLLDTARNRKCEITCRQEAVSLEMDLPATWEEYLATLAGKQRHEIKRKLRRLSEAGKVDYHAIEDRITVRDNMDTFLKMFAESREDKAVFLTARMESFFRSLADTMSKAGLMRLGILELDRLPVVMIMYFDYNDRIYLYNSGYDLQYSSLSVGLLCKVLCIKDSIQTGKKTFDFLKGGESYKYRLGGKEVPLHTCKIAIR